MPDRPRSSHPRLVTVPGLHGSEPAHWQSWLENEYPNALRVTQSDWDRPDIEQWTQRALSQLVRIDEPYVVAAHSFGCLTTVQALISDLPHLVGVLLVAPANPTRFEIAALNRRRLRVPSIVVASDTDPWMSATHARDLAHDWGSAYINLGDVGHINVASGFGPFPRARQFVEMLAQTRRAISA
ncbi:RBBP9/YdeN family alpha/beta hydrolase [Pararobbsia silviterrae]|uniref:RBBP9/YdeN family alpha/beta hydrolase n=1 Tax=Pararobbsia silviterrae TaxID=1792498 RepID=UPI001F0C669B|nr:alpha/beta hydrolase [Pararobbsia silviterrae]